PPTRVGAEGDGATAPGRPRRQRESPGAAPGAGARLTHAHSAALRGVWTTEFAGRVAPNNGGSRCRAPSSPSRNIPQPGARMMVWLPACNWGFGASGSADGHDVFGLRSLLALGDVELDLLPFLQAAIAATGDRAEVHEHVRATVHRDEAVTLVSVEPLHNALSHVPSPHETIFGTRGRATLAGADRLPIRLGYGVPTAPAVRIRRRC